MVVRVGVGHAGRQLCPCPSFGVVGLLLFPHPCPRPGHAQMSLTWRGVPGDRNSTRNTFRTVVMISLSYCVFEFVLTSMVPPGTRLEDFPPNIMIPLGLGDTFYSCWSLYLAVKILLRLPSRHLVPHTGHHIANMWE